MCLGSDMVYYAVDYIYFLRSSMSDIRDVCRTYTWAYRNRQVCFLLCHACNRQYTGTGSIYLTPSHLQIYLSITEQARCQALWKLKIIWYRHGWNEGLRILIATMVRIRSFIPKGVTSVNDLTAFKIYQNYFLKDILWTFISLPRNPMPCNLA